MGWAHKVYINQVDLLNVTCFNKNILDQYDYEF